MKTKPSAGRITLISLGILLLLASVSAWAVPRIAGQKVSVNCAEAAAYLEDILPARTTGIREARANNTLPAVSFAGQDFTALLTVPKFSVKLPVRSAWDKKAVKKVPCVYSGNPYEGTLIIGGTASDGQFDFVLRTDIGDPVTVTDMRGAEFHYTVLAVKHAQNVGTDNLKNENCDLTLFTKDKQTGKWVLVRCGMK